MGNTCKRQVGGNEIITHKIKGLGKTVKGQGRRLLIDARGLVVRILRIWTIEPRGKRSNAKVKRSE